MAEGSKTKPEDVKGHVPWLSETQFASALRSGDERSSVHEAYKKHSAELTSLEDRLNKTVLLILGLLGAGITAVSTISMKGAWPAALGFTVVVGIVGWVGYHAIHEAADLRRTVRDLLVRCELAMRFYEPNAFVEGRTLYDQIEREYPGKGKSLTLPNYVVTLGTAILLIILIWLNCLGLLKKGEASNPAPTARQCQSRICSDANRAH
jgi:hypothetical protein